LVFPVISFLLDLPPISYMHSASSPFLLHAPPISDFLIVKYDKGPRNIPSTFQLKIEVHKTVILPTDCYGCQTRSLTIREHGQRFLGSGAEENVWTYGAGIDRTTENTA
jgi:hypothetical protein